MGTLASDGYGPRHHVQVVTDLPHRTRARESTRKRQRTLLRRGQSVGATRAWELRNFALTGGYTHDFPNELENIVPIGPWQIALKAEMIAVSDAAARKQKRIPHAPRDTPYRMFLERHHQEAVSLQKLICAVLDEDVSA